MIETLNKFRIMILEDPEVPEVYLMIQDGMTEDEAYEIVEMYRDQGKTDLKVEEYFPDAHRLGRNAELH
jgi:hypothetical protein